MHKTKQMGPRKVIKITHKAHPLYGKRGELISVGKGRDPKLKVHLLNGTNVAIRRSWTDFHKDNLLKDSDGKQNLLEASDLLNMVKRIKEIKNQRDD